MVLPRSVFQVGGRRTQPCPAPLTALLSTWTLLTALAVVVLLPRIPPDSSLPHQIHHSACQFSQPG